MRDDPVDPEDCLRSLAAEALRWAPHRPLFPKSGLERMGFGNAWGVTKGELTVRPGAHEYWQSRMAGPGGLREHANCTTIFQRRPKAAWRRCKSGSHGHKISARSAAA